ncbi:MAG: encapsulin, partial [Pirellulales bacterium]|nr:encapsulin [Pirellulales bacterium]
VSEESGSADVPWGTRLVLPLLETRVTFQLDQMELDSIARGAKDADLAALEDAARRVALFEESAIYNGFEPARVEGILQQKAHQPISLPKNTQDFPAVVAQALESMRLAGIEGPFVLVLGSEAWAGLMQSGSGGYPPQRIISELMQCDLQMSPAIKGGVLISKAKGNFELTIGQDFSIGYVGHGRNKVELYLSESFTFRVLEPKGCVSLSPG